MKVVSISDKLGEDDRVLAEDAATALRTWLAMAEGVRMRQEAAAYHAAHIRGRGRWGPGH